MAYATLAGKQGTPLSILSTGDHLQAVIQSISFLQGGFEQFIVFSTPAFVMQLLHELELLSPSSPPFLAKNIKFCVIGESFDEGFREKLDIFCTVNKEITSMLSIYATPEVAIIGAESLATVAIRKIIYRHKLLAQSMGFDKELPHFFHFTARDTYLEEMEGELLITKWQCIPLVRYKLHDKVKMYSWEELRRFILSHRDNIPSNQPLYEVIENIPESFDIIAFSSRY